MLKEIISDIVQGFCEEVLSLRGLAMDNDFWGFFEKLRELVISGLIMVAALFIPAAAFYIWPLETTVVLVVILVVLSPLWIAYIIYRLMGGGHEEED